LTWVYDYVKISRYEPRGKGSVKLSEGRLPGKARPISRRNYVRYY